MRAFVAVAVLASTSLAVAAPRVTDSIVHDDGSVELEVEDAWINDPDLYELLDADGASVATASDVRSWTVVDHPFVMVFVVENSGTEITRRIADLAHKTIRPLAPGSRMVILAYGPESTVEGEIALDTPDRKLVSRAATPAADVESGVQRAWDVIREGKLKRAHVVVVGRALLPDDQMRTRLLVLIEKLYVERIRVSAVVESASGKHPSIASVIANTGYADTPDKQIKELDYAVGRTGKMHWVRFASVDLPAGGHQLHLQAGDARTDAVSLALRGNESSRSRWFWIVTVGGLLLLVWGIRRLSQ